MVEFFVGLFVHTITSFIVDHPERKNEDCYLLLLEEEKNEIDEIMDGLD